MTKSWPIFKKKHFLISIKVIYISSLRLYMSRYLSHHDYFIFFLVLLLVFFFLYLMWNHITYCWFSVPRHSKQIKIKIKTFQLIKSRIWEMKGDTYTRTLTKIQFRGIFRIRDIRRNVLPKLIEICMETPCWYSPGWAPTWRTETNKNICYWVLLQKREFILRATHKHQSNTFSHTWTV